METRLLTYAELGEALGITVDSAKRLARRRGWRKQPGNDGRARVAVPAERLVPRHVPAMTGRMTLRTSRRMTARTAPAMTGRTSPGVPVPWLSGWRPRLRNGVPRP